MSRRFFVDDGVAELLIGARNETGWISEEDERAIRSVLDAFSLRVLRSEKRAGFYAGRPEESLRVKVEFEDYASLFRCAERLRETMEQDSVGVASEACGLFLRVTAAMRFGETEDFAEEIVVGEGDDSFRLAWPRDEELTLKGGDFVQPYEPDRMPPEALRTWNVNLAALSSEYDAWFRARGMPVRYFMELDGGGVSFYVIEFSQRAHALEFIRFFGFRGNPYPWGEKRRQEGWEPFDARFLYD